MTVLDGTFPSIERTKRTHTIRITVSERMVLYVPFGLCLFIDQTMVVRERKNAFGQKAKFAFEERVRASCEPSFLLMPMPSVPDFSWYKIFTRLLPHLVQTFGTTFVLPTRLYGTNFFLVQFFWYNFFFWYKNVRVRVRPQEPDLRSVNAFGHFPFAFADTYE